jgi:hypothetical protein
MDRKIASFGNPLLDLWTWPLVIVKFSCNLIIKYMYCFFVFFGVYWFLSSSFSSLFFLSRRIWSSYFHLMNLVISHCQVLL